jgi:hypothetical protein
LLFPDSPPTWNYPPGSTEDTIAVRLKSGPQDIDTLIRECRIVPADFHRAAICMEVAGIIRRNGSIITLVADGSR